MRTEKLVPLAVLLLAGLLLVDSAMAARNGTERRLLRASEGLQMPGSEADSAWSFVSYPGEGELPDAGRMARLTGCPAEVARSDFHATFERLGRIEPWMDRGQRKSARGFRRLAKVFEREYGAAVAVYRCETGGPEVPVYFVGLDATGLSGLETVNIET